MKKYAFVLFFFIIAILCIFSFSKGYFFLLDYTPFQQPYSIYTIDLYTPLSWILFNWLPYFIPSWIFQRLVFIFSLMFLWLGWYYLFSNKSLVAAYFSGLFLMLNPFVYSRMIEWQIGIIIWLVMIVFFLMFLINYFHDNSKKNLFLSGLFSSLSIMWMYHSIYFVALILWVFFIANFIKHRNIKFLSYSLSVILWFILLLNINWISGIFLWNSVLSANVGQIEQSHFWAFSTAAWNNLYLNILSLHGFWWEAQWRFKPSFLNNWSWGVLFWFIFIIIIYWVYLRFKNSNNKYIEISLIIIALISFILSLGISHNNIFSWLNQLLYDYLPYYKGFREPQKWVSLLLIVYAYFGSYWIIWVYNLVLEKNFYPKFVAWLLVSLPIFYTPAMLFWFSGQLRVFDYPKERYSLLEKSYKWEIKLSSFENINFDNQCQAKIQWTSLRCYDMLSLPRHQYIWLSFAWKVIANPSEWFFYPIKVLQWDNMEIWPIYSQSSRPESKIIEKYLWPGWPLTSKYTNVDIENFIKALKWLWINYILMLKESDWINYDKLLTKFKDLGYIKAVESNDRFVLYIIK